MKHSDVFDLRPLWTAWIVNEREKIRTFVESMGDGFPTQQYKDKLLSQEFESICDK
jgi:hypothetical protein